MPLGRSVIFSFVLILLPGSLAVAQTDSSLPYYLQDRGTGVASSMFGTYIRRGELIVYPFLEYYKDDDFEYSGDDLGFTGDEDFRGRFRATEALLFIGYGLTDDIAIEFEAAAIDATFEKSPNDTTSVPSRIEESGLGDIEGQIRWRWRRETENTPELFSYSEVVLPHSGEKALIGTDSVEVKVGTGMTMGFEWGTMTVRGALEYADAFELGEYAVEYLKRLSPAWRVYLGIEGTQDEVSLVTEAQWHIRPNIVVKLNNGVGLTSKATDWAPEVGVMFIFPMR